MTFFKMAMPVLLAAFGFQALSTTLTYELHGGVPGEEFDKDFFVNFCGTPETFSMDSKEDIGLVILEKTQNPGYGKFTHQKIELSSGSVSGGGLEEPFMGDYRTHVYLTKQDMGPGGYAMGVFHRVEINTYGPTWAPKAFVVETRLLNYRSSAELAEGWFCRQFSYVLKN